MGQTSHLQIFSQFDVEILKESPADEIKIDLIRKLYDNFKLGHLEQDERLVAEEILRFLANDISIRIRQTIATKFCDNLGLPVDVALTLAHDLEDIVAVPIIQNFIRFDDSQLSEIIKSGNISRQVAVASRRIISNELCDELVTQAAPEAIQKLITNKDISFSHKQSEWLIAAHTSDSAIMRSLIQNKKIEVEQAYELMARVSEDLQKMLIITYNIPKSVVSNVVHDSKEWMIMNLILSHSQKRSDLTLQQIIKNLAASNELTFSLLIKTLSLGDITFFEAILAKLAGIPLENSRKLILSQDFEAFKLLYEQCGLPKAMLDAVYKLAIISLHESSMQSTSQVDSKVYHRILFNLSKTAKEKTTNNLDYLVTIVEFSLRKANLI